MENFKVEVFSKDDEDDCYCAIVMGHTKKNGWYNTGIVVREKDAILAFTEAIHRAEKQDFWSKKNIKREVNKNV